MRESGLEERTMNIFKISIKGVEIPIQKGIVDFGNDTTIEVKLDVHQL